MAKLALKLIDEKLRNTVEKFNARSAQLLSILMVINMLGAITVVPAFYSILRPKVATALLTDEQRETIRIQKEREVALGLRDKEQV